MPAFAGELLKRGRMLPLAAIGLLLCGSGDRLAAEHPSALLPDVPAMANALVAIDVESLLKTGLAQRHHWAEKHELEYAQRPVMVPSEATAVAIAASLDPQDELSVRWQVGVMQLKSPLEIKQVATWEGGYVDRVAGTDAAWTPSGCYMVQVANDRLAMVSPANRQLIAQWIERRDSGRRDLISDYLRQAAQQVTPKTQIVMALDLQEAIAPHQLKEGLQRSEALFQQAVRTSEYQQLVAGLKGITLKVSVSTHGDGELRFDFSSAPKADALTKQLVMEALDRNNMHLEELESWQASVDGTALVLKGRFTPEGLRRVGSLLQLPTTKFSDLEGVQPAEPGTPDYAQRSQMYYSAVCALIDDLNKTLKANRDNHAVWMERYGSKVDALPILNVDDELLAWGASVGETFRTMGLAQRSSGVRQGVRKSAVYGNYYSDGDGYYEDRPEANQRNEIRRQEEAQASKVRFESWKELEDSRAQMRIQMTKKYGVEF